MPKGSGPLQAAIQRVELPISQGGAVLIPSRRFDASLADRATGKVGHVGYALLRSQAFAALPQLSTTIRTLVEPLQNATMRWRETPESERGDAEGERIEQLGRAVHWEVITRLGMIVENLVGLLAALDRYRQGSSDQVAHQLLRHELDLLKPLQEKRRRQLTYWEGAIHAPSTSELAAAGLTAREAQVVKAAGRRAAFGLLASFNAVRGYYTGPVHQVYLRFKHGYTLVNPGFSRLYIGDLGPKRGAAVSDAFARGFAVAHETWDGKHALQIVRSSPDDLRGCIRIAQVAVTLAQSLALAWVLELEQPQDHNGLLVFDRQAKAGRSEFESGAMKWLGPDIDAVYGLSAVLQSLEEVPPAAR